MLKWLMNVLFLSCADSGFDGGDGGDGGAGGHAPAAKGLFAL